MNNKELRKEIEGKAWGNINLPSNKSIDNIHSVLYKIIDFNENEEENANTLGNEFIDSIGSNHGGYFFPVIEDVVDLLINILESSNDNRKRKLLVLGILNDLFYFDLDTESKKDTKIIDKYNRVKIRLSKYSDEQFPNHL